MTDAERISKLEKEVEELRTMLMQHFTSHQQTASHRNYHLQMEMLQDREPFPWFA